MTANVMAEDRARCAEAGMRGFLAKPLEAAEVAEELRRTTSRATTRDAPAGADPARTHTVIDLTDSPTGRALARLQETVGGDPALVREIVEEFVRHTPATIDDIRRAWRDDVLDDLRRNAHSLKGNARLFGDDGLAEIAAELEATTDDPDRPRVATLIDEIERVVADLLAELRSAVS